MIRARWLIWTATLLAGLMPGLAALSASATNSIATFEEARIVAENWLTFIVARDGHWGGARDPSIGECTEFGRGDLLLGYYVSVRPQGYMVISSLKDFAPIKAYSTTSYLAPDEEFGMCALLKDVLESRAKFLIHRFGELDKASLQELRKSTPDANRLAWSYLLAGGSALGSNLRSIYPQSNTPVGPLLETSWHQRPPYNDDCPNEGCSSPDQGNYNQNAPVGCTQLATAQLMRYYCWPPFFNWPDILNQYVYDPAANWFNDENGNPCTQAQIDAVAHLCKVSGDAMYTSYGCGGTQGALCHWLVDDARDALEDYFLYSDPEWDEPFCEERDSYGDDAGDFVAWWYMIKGEIDKNRPVLYRIASGAVFVSDFDHIIVVDGYDNTGGQYQVHANYGWDDPHTTWYTLNTWHCSRWDCSWDEEEMVWFIYHRDGLCFSYTGTLGPRTSPTDPHHYVYCDVGCHGVIVQAGAWVQFLPGTAMTCSTGSIDIYGRTPDETRFFSRGLPTRGLKVAGGKIRLHPNGSIRVH